MVSTQMTELYRIIVQPTCTLEQAWSFLEAMGIEILYGSEEEEQIELFAKLASLESIKKISWIKACEPYTLPPIDWEAQWETHGLHYQEGHVHVDLAAYGRPGKLLKLCPGAGFGDLSHPTTRLMLYLLGESLNDQQVVDIGCGSGILTLAALGWDCPYAYGIDIDPQALVHSHENNVLNGLENKCSFYLPEDFAWKKQSNVLIMMNMIRTEQREAWSSLPSLHGIGAEILTSGIRVEERAFYLDQIAKWGWSLKSEREEMGWLAFVFVANAL